MDIYRAVEVAGLSPAARQILGRELARAGLVAFANHSPLDQLRADLEGVAAECREWGREFVVVPALPNAERTLDAAPFMDLSQRVAFLIAHRGGLTKRLSVAIGQHPQEPAEN